MTTSQSSWRLGQRLLIWMLIIALVAFAILAGVAMNSPANDGLRSWVLLGIPKL